MPKVFRDKEGVEILQGVAFERDGLAFPANWLDLATQEDLADRGIVCVIEPDVEPPAPTPVPEPTPLEKLNAIGLSVEDLKELLA